MKNISSSWNNVHPFTIFWLGVLTGAFIVGMVFMYRFFNAIDYQSAIVMPKTPAKSQSVKQKNKLMKGSAATVPDAAPAVSGGATGGTNWTVPDAAPAVGGTNWTVPDSAPPSR